MMATSRYNDTVIGLLHIHQRWLHDSLCRFQGWPFRLGSGSIVASRKGWAEGWTDYDPHKQRLRPTVQPVQPNRACVRARTRVRDLQ